MNPAIVQHFVEHYPLSKSCGIDSIHTKILRVVVRSNFLQVLSDLFRLCCRTGRTPTGWNHAIVCFIPKKGFTAVQHVDEMRPIFLTVMFRRIFEGCILRYIDKSRYLADVQATHPTQAGFKRGYSTMTHALATHEHCLREDCYTVFLDLKAAYDRVPVPLLLRKLEERRAPGSMVSLIGSLFLCCSMQAVVDGVLTPVVHRERGLMQGSLLSPFLFNLFIDDLARSLSSIGRTPSTGAPYACSLEFADDILIFYCSTPTQSWYKTCWTSVRGGRIRMVWSSI